MFLDFYKYITEIVEGDCNIWIRGDSDTGKTTFLKYLFDCDRAHHYKWILGGCNPSRTEIYYQQSIKDILETKYISNATMTIYVDEVLEHHVKKLIDLKTILGFPIHLIIVSHNWPPDNLKEQFTFFQMTDILPISMLRKYINQSCNFAIPVETVLSISDCFFIIDHLNEINSMNDFMKLCEENSVANQQRKKIKMTVEHNIWILQTQEYERINILKIKEAKCGTDIIN